MLSIHEKLKSFKLTPLKFRKQVLPSEFFTHAKIINHFTRDNAHMALFALLQWFPFFHYLFFKLGLSNFSLILLLQVFGLDSCLHLLIFVLVSSLLAKILCPAIKTEVNSEGGFCKVTFYLHYVAHKSAWCTLATWSAPHLLNNPDRITDL